MVKVVKKLETVPKLESVHHCMEALEIETCAYEHGFYKRSPKKITASSLLLGFWEMQSKGKNTLRNWAVQTGVQVNESVSKQAIDKRLNSALLEVVKTSFEKAIKKSQQGKMLETKLSVKKKN